ncbi:fimbria/pilus periplasmic chaperone [Kluyvera sp. CHPC 1.251]|uniref:fimbria/pilus periplasmic chaperone n=1 Tax=Kluyvera sp. CHPC 1.251 TaxID=2995175 RepID=UPI002FD82D90
MKKFLCIIAILFVSSAQASVVIGGTRLIFNGANKVATITVENKDKVTNIVQSWITSLEPTSAKQNLFVATPPLFKLKASEQGTVRIVRTGGTLPEDRESMFWLNVKGIPASENIADKNVVQFAINSRIKLIYRPSSLQDANVEDYASKLQWSQDGDGVKVNNTSPMYLSFSKVTVDGKDVSGSWFVAPFSTLRIPVLGASKRLGNRAVIWSVINDYGMSGKKYTGSTG